MYLLHKRERNKNDYSTWRWRTVLSFNFTKVCNIKIMSENTIWEGHNWSSGRVSINCALHFWNNLAGNVVLHWYKMWFVKNYEMKSIHSLVYQDSTRFESCIRSQTVYHCIPNVFEIIKWWNYLPWPCQLLSWEIPKTLCLSYGEHPNEN